MSRRLLTAPAQLREHQRCDACGGGHAAGLHMFSFRRQGATALRHREMRASHAGLEHSLVIAAATAETFEPELPMCAYLCATHAMDRRA